MTVIILFDVGDVNDKGYPSRFAHSAVSQCNAPSRTTRVHCKAKAPSGISPVLDGVCPVIYPCDQGKPSR
jgi:hypothetical protein